MADQEREREGEFAAEEADMTQEDLKHIPCVLWSLLVMIPSHPLELWSSAAAGSMVCDRYERRERVSLLVQQY